MPKKTDKFLDKIVKKDYSNELEKILEKKPFDENTKNMLLSVLYKIEAAYKDYEKVKVSVENKEEFIESFINSIKNNCDDIKVIKLNSRESELLGNKTFLVEKNQKTIICYPIERKLLYCIAKIDKKEKIIKDKYQIINETLTDLINVGNNINTVEPIRDFNGFSWTTIPREIESIFHNLVYQNMRILVGSKFLNKWIKNNEYIIDYLESFKNRLEEQYGNQEQQEVIQLLNKVSVLLAISYHPKLKKQLLQEKIKVESELEKAQNNQEFVQKITEEKRELTKEIKQLDETLNNKNLLQQEYEKRNEFLPLEQKIFSSRILSKMMIEERQEKVKKIEDLNVLLNPQSFISYKQELEAKEKYLKLVDVEDLEKEIQDTIIRLQKIFLICYQKKVQKIDNKQDLMNKIYEFRYYCVLPFNELEMIAEVEQIKNEIQEVEILLIEKAHELKLVDYFSKDREDDYQILRNIFHIRIINLEDLYSKIVKEQDSYYVQLFDEEIFEEKIKIENRGTSFKINKKIKIFNL